jgi:hypothetical protein
LTAFSTRTSVLAPARIGVGSWRAASAISR